MDTNKVLSALSYFSILFAGIIFPIIVYFVSDDLKVKAHAKKALYSHLIPLIPIPLFLITFIIGVSSGGNGEFIFSAATFILIGLTIILSFGVLIWNIIKGVKVFQNE